MFSVELLSCKPLDCKLSHRATSLLREIASNTKDFQVATWMNQNPGFEFSGLPLGWVRRQTNGQIRIGLNRCLLKATNSLKTRFAIAHELGHVSQLLNTQNEAPLFTKQCFIQELDASEFAIQATAQTRCTLFERRYRLKSYRCAMALEASFPGLSHGAAFVIIWSAAYFAGNWLWDD
jgi:hypothetical protein